jgi:hypothetical protein
MKKTSKSRYSDLSAGDLIILISEISNTNKHYNWILNSVIDFNCFKIYSDSWSMECTEITNSLIRHSSDKVIEL